MQLSLYDLQIGETGVVTGINTNKAFKQRLQDIGLTKNSKVRVLHSSPCGNPRAYLIRGSVIALRNCVAQKIMVLRGNSGE